MLYIIGLGLWNEQDITINGLEAIKKCTKVYLEQYTSILACTPQKLEALYGKRIEIATRTTIEQQAEKILAEAKTSDVALLVAGDVFGATTHADLVLRAKKAAVPIQVIHNASIINAVGCTGLELYKFGKTTSMPFFDTNWEPETAYEVIRENKNNGLHTLVLLDIKVAEPTKEALLKGNTNVQQPTQTRFMTIKQCIEQLQKIEHKRKEDVITPDIKLLACARIGHPDQKIAYGTAQQLMQQDMGEPLHCLIIPGKLHFIEEEMLELWSS